MAAPSAFNLVKLTVRESLWTLATVTTLCFLGGCHIHVGPYCRGHPSFPKWARDEPLVCLPVSFGPLLLCESSINICRWSIQPLPVSQKGFTAMLQYKELESRLATRTCTAGRAQHHCSLASMQPTPLLYTDKLPNPLRESDEGRLVGRSVTADESVDKC